MQGFTEAVSLRAGALRLAVVLGGIVVLQAILYGPSLLGTKLLLPLDTLALPGFYLPTPAAGQQRIVPHDWNMTDPVVELEPLRRFTVAEVRAGRMPLWNPYIYGGAPHMAANQTSVFSPFMALAYLFPNPIVLAWTEMLKALVGGLGAYLFFRRALVVRFWPATIGAWCFGLMGCQIFWQPFALSVVVLWLPWSLLAIDALLRRGRGWGGPGLALVTALIMVSGHAAQAAFVLLATGGYFLWFLVARHGFRALWSARVGGVVLAAVCAWMLGFVLSAPQNVPTIEYLRMSNRIAERDAGHVDIYPVGWRGLPQMALPLFHGATTSDSNYVAPLTNPDAPDGRAGIGGSRVEGVAAGYAGLFMVLVLAPLGLSSRRHRAFSIFWLLIGIFGAGEIIDIPMLKAVYDWFPFSMLLNNRFIFITGWSALALGVVGLDVLWSGEQSRRWWYVLPLALVVALGAWSASRAMDLPDGIADMADRMQQGGWGSQSGYVYHSLEVVSAVQRNFATTSLIGAAWCALAAIVWLLLCFSRKLSPTLRNALACLVIIEMLVTQYGSNTQSDPDLDYPRIAALEKLAQAPPGRICGLGVFPANLGMVYQLRDIRGYDGTDPGHLVDVLELARQPGSTSYGYAKLQLFMPRPSPIMNMLNVRYLIGRGSYEGALGDVLIAQDDYWVWENPSALPRAYVPQNVYSLPNQAAVLRVLAQPNFNPAREAFITEPMLRPLKNCVGQVRIVSQTPTSMTLAVDMQTPGAVVLADLWFEGWQAQIDGEPVPVQRTNYAIRSVFAPAGKSTLVFRYDPASFRIGLWLGGAGLLAWLAWCAAAAMPGKPAA
jgi:hypothetical protein